MFDFIFRVGGCGGGGGAELGAEACATEGGDVEVAVEADSVIGEGGEVGLGGAAAEAVVCCVPGCGVPGSRVDVGLLVDGWEGIWEKSRDTVHVEIF